MPRIPCPQCESTNVTCEYTPAEPDVGLFAEWLDFYCHSCEHSWEVEPRDLPDFDDEPVEEIPDIYEEGN